MCAIWCSKLRMRCSTSIAHIQNWWKQRQLQLLCIEKKTNRVLLTLAPVRLQLRTQCRTAFELHFAFLPLETVFHRSVAVLLFLAVIELRNFNRKRTTKLFDFHMNQLFSSKKNNKYCHIIEERCLGIKCKWINFFNWIFNGFFLNDDSFNWCKAKWEKKWMVKKWWRAQWMIYWKYDLQRMRCICCNFSLSLLYSRQFNKWTYPMLVLVMQQKQSKTMFEFVCATSFLSFSFGLVLDNGNVCKL